jgi:hypothetical protein
VPSFSDLSHGQLALTGSAQRLTTDDDFLGAIAVRAMTANAGKVYVGSSSSVSPTNGYELNAGEAVSLDITGAQLIWVIGTASDRVCWISISPS